MLQNFFPLQTEMFSELMNSKKQRNAGAVWRLGCSQSPAPFRVSIMYSFLLSTDLALCHYVTGCCAALEQRMSFI